MNIKFKRKGVLLLGCIIALLSGCVINPPTEKVALTVLPKGGVVRNITYFEESLACMDQLFLNAGIHNVLIGSDGLPDATERVDVGSRQILISTISRMAAESEAFRFVDYYLDRPLNGLLDLRNALDAQAEKLTPPSFFIGGAITQIDSKVLEANTSSSLIFNNINTYIADLGLNRNYVSSIISLDLHIGTFYSRQVVPGLEATNSIAITRTSREDDFTAHFKLHSIPFSFSIDKNEGPHAAIRMLIQLSLIESLGKLAEVPYWQCLGLPSTNPKVHATAYETYRSLDENSLQEQVRTALIKAGYLDENDTETLLSNAVARYQNNYNLIANGEIDFNLYFKLMQQYNDLSAQEKENLSYTTDVEQSAQTANNDADTISEEKKSSQDKKSLLHAIGLEQLAETDDDVDLSQLSPSLWVIFYEEDRHPSINSLGFATEHRQLKQLTHNHKSEQRSNDLSLSQEEFKEICNVIRKSDKGTSHKKLQMLLIREKDPESKIVARVPEIDPNHCLE